MLHIHNSKSADAAQAADSPVTQQQLIDIITRSNKDLNNQLSEMLKDELKTLSSKLDEIGNRVSNNEEQVESHSENIERIESDLQSHTPSNEEELLMELNDRMRREKNVIIFNMPGATSANDDRTKICEFLSGAPFDISSIHTTRLGKQSASSQHTRPLKVFLKSSDEVIWAMKQFKSLTGKNISCKRDKTLSQRTQLKCLYNELNNRKSKGELNLIIRYVNNIPRIVQKN
ncbi:hypothetical protein QAD02_020877 [Eretmocerus hayati]|uniref:Uncharacterized protein n=1 Tax=Eretmocerus hayati TaxID=131215 RepID=A0ACC2PR63_9HYME|nr:hypothetical protein QAD02_020877 [Eretmocerus hayati]